MKVVIAGGGTGGHLYPGIAIARETLRESSNEVLFIGTSQGIEARVLPKENLPVRYINAGKLKGMNMFSRLKTIVLLPQGLLQSIRLMREVQPNVVLGVGGYASAPVGVSALLLGIPLVIVEPNSFAGLANRVLGRLADKVILCFPGTGAQDFFPAAKTIMLGPLVRKGIECGDREKALQKFELESNRFTVFVMGGSGGAHAINMVMTQAAGYLKNMQNLQVIHQTGEKDVADVTAGYQSAGIKAAVRAYIDNMAGAYAAADLVIARSGATSVAELAVCNKPAVLVPFPFAADNHQEYNARTLAKRGNVDVILQNELTAALLVKTIKKYVAQRADGLHAAPMANTAAGEIVEICKHYVQKN
jgi:UDP-N-acetylglucosamine--N-acetylmuramyl-(pentapeptide) pyrophosphoryl-undecaprenol N-acetylglucosamine transferase